MAKLSKTGIGVSGAKITDLIKPTSLAMRDLSVADIHGELAKSRILEAVQSHIHNDIGANFADVSFSLDFGLDF